MNDTLVGTSRHREVVAWGGTCPRCHQVIDIFGQCGCSRYDAGADAYLREMMNAAELGEDVDWAGVFTVIDVPAEAVELAIEDDYEWIRRGC